MKRGAILSIAFCLCFLVSCQGEESSQPVQPADTQDPPATPAAVESTTTLSTSTSASSSQTATTTTTLALAPALAAGTSESTCPAEGGYVLNADFGIDTEGWTARYGRIATTDATFTSEPRSAVLVTSDAQGLGNTYQGIMGQCVEWEEPAKATPITVEAYVQGDPDILTISSTVFFHAASRCRGEILEVANLPAVAGGEGWVHLAQNVAVPAGTNSIDLVVSASGGRATAAVAIDDFCAHP